MCRQKEKERTEREAYREESKGEKWSGRRGERYRHKKSYAAMTLVYSSIAKRMLVLA